MFAFDFAGVEDVVGQCGETGLAPQAKADIGKPGGLPDVSVIAAVNAVIVRSNRRISNAYIL
jgi:hypothetical protein